MTKTSHKKSHADFQSRYRRSFNFHTNTNSDKLVLNEDGELVLKKQRNKE